MKIFLVSDASGNEAGITKLGRAFTSLGHNLCENIEDADLIVHREPCSKLVHYQQTKTVYWEIDGMRLQGINANLYDVDKLFVGGSREAIKYYPVGTQYLPCAVEPEFYKNNGNDPDFDVVFVGCMYPEREKLLKEVSKYFKTLITNTSPGKDYVNALNRGKLIFNKSGFNELNNRFFEGMAIGCLISDYIPGHDDLAAPDQHYISYKSEKEMLEKINIYLQNEELRKNMIALARTNIINNHTYQHRAKTILDNI